MKSFFLLPLALLLLCVNTASAQNILSLTHSDLKISLNSKTNTAFTIEITANKSLTAEIFALENPSRLVIDLLDLQSQRSLTESINHPIFSQLRIGVHPSKTRLVFDVNYPHAPSFSQKTLENKVVIDLSLSDSSPSKEIAPDEAETTIQLPIKEHEISPKVAPEEAEDTPAQKEEDKTEVPLHTKQPNPKDHAEIPSQPAPIESPEDTTSSEVEIPIESENTPKEVVPPAVTLEKEDKPVASSKKPDEDPFEDATDAFFEESKQRALIQKIIFSRTSDNENAIAIQVEHLGRYSFLKSAPQSYSLVIENARAEEDKIMLTQFPPDGYQGIEAVTAYKRGKNIIVKVYVETGITLLPYRQGSELWIKASH